jgi:TolB-like protein
MRRNVWLMIISFVFLPLHQAAAQQSAAQIRKGGYEQIEVTRFEVEDGIDFPPAFIDSINEEIIARLQETKKFKRVMCEGEEPSVPQKLFDQYDCPN